MNKTRRKMNSFKKIALAMVAALTLGTLVSTPASANTLSVVATTWNASATPAAFDTPATAGTALASAIVRVVPEDNKIDNTDVVRFVATVAAGTSVTASATNATIVAALHNDAAPVSSASGSTSLTIATGTGTTATFYVYTKTTAIGTVVFTNGVNTTTFYVQGTVGKIHTLSVSAPANAPSGTKQDVVVTATDVFGNKVSDKQITATVFANSGTLDTATVTTGTTLATFGQATFKVTVPATGFTRTLVTFAPTTAGDAVSATAVAGLATPILSPFAEIAVRDMASELKAAQDALAAEKAAAATAKTAADKALADALAKATADAAAAKLAADAALAAAVKAEADKAAAEKAATAKVTADTLAAKDAEIAKLKADNAAALAAIKKAFNDLAKKWNAKNPKAKVTLVK
jgi:hypothetical protein